MENFFLLKGNNSDFEKVQMLFDKHFNDSQGIIRQFGEYSLYLSKKGSQFPDNFYERDEFFIGSIGTPVYKGLSYSEGLKEILGDELKGKISLDELYGHYILFVSVNKVLKIYYDGSGLIKAYFDTDGTYFCSSFLILREIQRSLLSLNKHAIAENLVTGGLIGGETVYNEIKEFTPGTKDTILGIKINMPEFKQYENSKNNEEAFSLQVDFLDHYFSSIKNLADDFGVNTGLTSGYDSRLLLSLIKRHFRKFHVHSHFRNQSSVEWNTAKLITKECNIEFISPEVRSFVTFSDEELLQVIDSSYKFYDGQIRFHCNWNEEYNTLEYRRKIFGDKRLGFHGIGGEQYRNADRMCLWSWDFDNWIKYRFIRRVGGASFKDIETEYELCKHIKSKICNELGFSHNKKTLTLFDLKRIENEVFIPSFRGARTNAENKLSFFLSPFSDFHVSRAAYVIVPFFDCTNNFEINLIRTFSAELAKYPTNYGFSPDRNEPLRKYLGPVVFENILPAVVSCTIRELLKRSRLSDLFKDKIKSSALLKRYSENVLDLNLPVDIDKLLIRPESAPLVISMGFFLENQK